MNELFYEEEYPIMAYSLDCYDQLSLVGILDIFQNIAGYHSELLGIGFDDLKKIGITWLLVRTKFDVIRPLTQLRKVNVKTWQSYKGRVDYERDYLICDEAGEVLVKGTSKWCLVDINARKIVPTTKITDDITYPNKRNYRERFAKLEFPLFKAAEEKTFAVYRSHLDHNFHVNNTKYGEFITNLINLPRGVSIKSFSIDYIKEVRLDEELIMKYEKNNSEYLIEGYTNNEIAIRSFLEIEKR